MSEDKNKDIKAEEMNEEDGDGILVLQDEDGKEVEFYQIATIDYENDWYIFLQPVELGDMEEDEMLIFRIDSDADGNDVFEPIEDDNLIDKLYDLYLDEYENESECDNCGSDCSEGCSCSNCSSKKED